MFIDAEEDDSSLSDGKMKESKPRGVLIQQKLPGDAQRECDPASHWGEAQRSADLAELPGDAQRSAIQQVIEEKPRGVLIQQKLPGDAQRSAIQQVIEEKPRGVLI